MLYTVDFIDNESDFINSIKLHSPNLTREEIEKLLVPKHQKNNTRLCILEITPSNYFELFYDDDIASDVLNQFFKSKKISSLNHLVDIKRNDSEGLLKKIYVYFNRVVPSTLLLGFKSNERSVEHYVLPISKTNFFNDQISTLIYKQYQKQITDIIQLTDDVSIKNSTVLLGYTTIDFFLPYTNNVDISALLGYIKELHTERLFLFNETTRLVYIKQLDSEYWLPFNQYLLCVNNILFQSWYLKSANVFYKVETAKYTPGSSYSILLNEIFVTFNYRYIRENTLAEVLEHIYLEHNNEQIIYY